LTAAAFLWSVGLLAVGSATPVDENGRGILFVLAVPAVISLVAGVSLWRKHAHDGHLSGYFAWVCVGLLGAFCLVGILTVGLFAVPVALLLGSAASLPPSGSVHIHGF
jgi:hypothetical protein